ncbi:MAG: ATP-binding protein [Nanoarchaeota archaeon]|nr:ATP-binding protein [Nanoarchaeota archaeon]MBU1320751.1 ATP-binding protein [Nanoarchaeota archaeon]MBU1597810.1 ATP-binding protein [Nanoarchaeota archaeon]MBU2441498.1 ATP-binding protein [Nanoarchaeota archaeon]
MEYKKIIVEWKEFKIPKILPRQAEVNLASDFIIAISGPRRAGKTYFCFQIMNSLLEKGLPKDNLLYINFEDNKLINAQAEDLDKLLEAFLELFQPEPKKPLYFFLDEIQTVKDWDAWVRKINDTQKNIKLILTGSSSKLLSRELSTRLRGRVINHEIYPLSFKETLSWKNINYSLKTISYSKERITIKKTFREYLKKGGFPATLTQPIPEENILQSYYSSMLFKDVVERHDIKDVKKLKTLASLLFESTASEISYNKLANKLKSLGFDISKNTIIEHISHFEDAYLFFQNIKYEYSLGKQLGSIKKIYCIDNGLLNSVSFKFTENTGRLMENLTFLELKRRNKTIYYYRQKHECDFLIQEKNKITTAIQVCAEITDENKNREIKGLLDAMNAFKLKEGTIITYEQEEEIKENGKKIKIIPAWKWLLKEE